MQIERFFVPGLAHASHLVASAGEAVLVDPERNVAGYVAYLAQNKLKLNGIFLTHPHADSWPVMPNCPLERARRSFFPTKLPRRLFTATSKRVIESPWEPWD